MGARKAKIPLYLTEFFNENPAEIYVQNKGRRPRLTLIDNVQRLTDEEFMEAVVEGAYWWIFEIVSDEHFNFINFKFEENLELLKSDLNFLNKNFSRIDNNRIEKVYFKELKKVFLKMMTDYSAIYPFKINSKTIFEAFQDYFIKLEQLDAKSSKRKKEIRSFKKDVHARVKNSFYGLVKLIDDLFEARFLSKNNQTMLFNFLEQNFLHNHDLSRLLRRGKNKKDELLDKETFLRSYREFLRKN
jgi:hypothetical protein